MRVSLQSGEAAKLRSSGYLQAIAEGVARGILDYLERTKQDPYAGVAPLTGEGARLAGREERRAFE